MLVCAAGPRDDTAEGLHALYVSLNSPVVTLDALPVGPAAAAIAVHVDAGATLLVRSARTGTVAFFHAAPRSGRDAALSHAEGLGFLFEEAASQGSAGLERDAWPEWLAEVFSAASAACLSKFRWTLGARPGAAAGEAGIDVRRDLSSRM